MTTLTMRDGVDLHLRDEGSGPTIMIVPGWGVSGWWFREQFAGLTDRHRVVCFDPRGQGRSTKTAHGQRVARLAADLSEVLSHVGAEPVHLLAWSGGASTALQYLELYGGDRLASLTLVGGSPKLMRAEDWELGFLDLAGAVDWVTLVRNDFEAAARAILPQFFAAELPAEDFEAALTEMLLCDPDGASTMSWDFIHQDFRDLLSSIAVRTLLIAGEHDSAVPAGNAPYMHRTIPGSRLEIVPQAAHCPFLEQPHAFNEIISTFVTGN